jgi:hypothetical protein
MDKILDALGQRYGIRPSQILGMNPQSGQALLFDMRIAGMGAQHQLQQSSTLSGRISAKRMMWPEAAKREIRRQKRNAGKTTR